jgi:hypothetical protein
MRRRAALALWIGLGLAASGSPAHAAPPAFPLSVAPDQRRLLDANGRAFFVTADSPWSLIVGPDLAGAESYLENRRLKGFNAVLVNLVEHLFHGPTNAYGEDPFLVPGDFSTPNEDYFAHADAVIAAAEARGIVVFLAPAYLGYNGGAEGWYSEVLASGAQKMHDYGVFVGARYAGSKNIVWVMGGDYAPNAALPAIRALVAGIEEGAGTPQLFTVHNSRHEAGLGQYPAGEPWIDLNTVYSACAEVAGESLEDGYAEERAMPFVFIEGTYENEGGEGQCARGQAYGAVLSGAAGHFFGNRPIWLFDPGWPAALDSTGALDVQRAQRLFDSRRFGPLEPDVSHTLLTSGFGNPFDGSYASAALTLNANTALIYTPTRRALRVDLHSLRGDSVKATWYNPRTGAVTAAGTFAKTSTQVLTPPATGDWVLVLDNAALTLPTPGGTPLQPQCDDAIDNDGDALVDYPADPSCFGRLDDREAQGCGLGFEIAPAVLLLRALRRRRGVLV